MTNPITTSATRFRIFLTISMILSVAVIVTVVVYGVGFLNRYAAEVNEIAVEAAVSEGRIDTLRAEAERLATLQDAASRAEQIVAESQSYQYQDVIIRDLEEFARRAGVRVTTYDFTAESSQSPAAPQATPPAPDPAAQSAPDAEGTVGADPTAQVATPASNLKGTTVSVSLDNPLNYRSLLRFMHYIEQNLTKMQIASVTMSGDPENPDRVTSGNFIIEVYIR